MVEIIPIQAREIYSDQKGYECITELYSRLRTYKYSTIKLDGNALAFWDANLCSPIGAILYKVGRNLNTFEIINLNSEIEKIFRKNGFLTSYGRSPLTDIYGSTIQYRRFEPNEDRLFNYYIDEQLKNKAMPSMSAGLYKRFIEGLMEIFSNAVIHSETKLGIFVCGQYFHRQNRLDFTISDLGIGFRRNIYKNLSLNLSAEKAIEWALEGNNTTKRGKIPGGLGLKLLREFISQNQGKLQIISENGYWEQTSTGEKRMALLPHAFPGTIVNLEINTADQNAYCLASESKVEIPF